MWLICFYEKFINGMFCNLGKEYLYPKWLLVALNMFYSTFIKEIQTVIFPGKFLISQLNWKCWSCNWSCFMFINHITWHIFIFLMLSSKLSSCNWSFYRYIHSNVLALIKIIRIQSIKDYTGKMNICYKTSEKNLL